MYPKIILLRHGETVWNREGRYQGKQDSPLTPKGELQAKENAKKIKNHIADLDEVVIYASPLGRAKSTAEIICNEMGIDPKRIVFDTRIEEFGYGIFEGKTKAFCQTEYTQIFLEREANKWRYQIEGGESYALVTQRLHAWLSELKSDQTLLVIAHEMVNRALRGLYLGLKKEEILLLRQPNSVVLSLDKGMEKIIT